MIRELQKGDRLTADWARGLVRALRRCRITAGHGLRATETPDGTVISLAQPLSPGRRPDQRPRPFDLRRVASGLSVYMPTWYRNGLLVPPAAGLTDDPDMAGWCLVPASSGALSSAAYIYAYLQPAAGADKAWPITPEAELHIGLHDNARDGRGLRIAVIPAAGASVVQLHRGPVVDAFGAGDAQVHTPGWIGGAAVDSPTRSIDAAAGGGHALYDFADPTGASAMDDEDLLAIRRVVSSVPTLVWATLAALAQWIKTWLLSNGSGGGLDDDLIHDIIDKTDGRYWRTGDTDGTTTRGGYIYDNSSNQAIDITNRRIYTKGVAPSIDADTRDLIDGSEHIAIKYGARTAHDSTGVVSVDWGSRLLSDSLAAESVSWESRNLAGSWQCDTNFKTPTMYCSGLYVAEETAEWQSLQVVTDVAVDAQGHVTSVTKKTVEYLGKAPY